VAIDEIGQIEIQFPDGDIDVVWIDTEARMETFGGFFQPLTIRALQRDCFEQNHHDEVQSPNLKSFQIII
jgi:hypothetical protein